MARRDTAADQDRNQGGNWSEAGPCAMVSVVMAVRNAESTIVEAIRSVLDQTMTALELIVCNDASTDRTPESLVTISDARLRVMHNSHNLGPGASRDIAIRAASAPWIAFIDADDAWLPHRLETMLAAARGRPAFVFDDIMQCHDSSRGMIPWRSLRAGQPFSTYRNGDVVPIELFVVQERLLVKPLIPRSVIVDNEITHSDLRVCEDNEFFLRVLATGLPIRYVGEALYLYRLTPGSATHNPQKHRLARQAVEQVKNLAGFKDSAKKAIRIKLAQLEREETYEVFRKAVRSAEVREIAQALRANPWIVRHFLRRAFGDAGYHLHRAIQSGRGRGSQ